MDKTNSSSELKLTAKQLVNLVDVKDRSYQLDSPNELAVFACNESHKVVNFFQSVVWHKNKLNRIEVLTASGVSRVEPNSIIAQFIVKLVKYCLASKNPMQPTIFTVSDIDDEQLKSAWKEQLPPYLHWLPFTQDDEIDAGFLIFDKDQTSKTESTLLLSLAHTFSHLWYSYPANKKKRTGVISRVMKSSLNKVLILLFILLLLCIPVRESSLAPASIVPSKPIVISSSISGVIQDIHVQPNDFVKKGDLLVSLDSDKLASDLDVAKKEYESVNTEYLVASQRAFDEGEAKAQVNLLKSKVEASFLAVERAEALLERSKIFAVQDGLAVFTDKYEFLGQQVNVGERILLLADVDAVEIDIYMPVGDTIDFKVNDEVLLFLNTDPTKPIKANLKQTSYEPSKRENGDFVFHLKATFDASEYSGRIGWAGTAKVYSSNKVSLFMYLFRRPISTLRRFLGV